MLRDVLQMVGIHNEFTQIGHWGHEWCGGACDYITLPIDAYLIVASIIVIKRNKPGFLDASLLVVLLLSLLMWLLP